MKSMKSSAQNDWKATVAILGARKHYGVQAALALNNRLERMYTDFYMKNIGVIGLLRKMLLHSPFRSFRRAAMRYTKRLPDNCVHSFPLIGLAYAAALRLAGSAAKREQLYVCFGRWFSQSVAQRGFGASKVVYGMNAGSVELFQQAHKAGLACVLEQSSAPYTIYDRLSFEEYYLWPDWTIESAPHRNLHLSERETREWDLSDLIICGSQFVANGLELHGIPKEKYKIIPSPVDVDNYPNNKKTSHQKLRVLFLGSISIMKGIQYFYQALQQINSSFIEAKAAGNILVSGHALKKMKRHIHFLGVVPRAEIYSLLDWADVLILPSICEGSALVTYEALASGVPVITTSNSGSHVQDCVTGFIVPIRDYVSIANRIDQLVTDIGLRRNMSIAARHFAEEHLSWDVYSVKLLSVLQNIL